MSDFHNNRTVRTRKTHSCEQCGTAINAGETCTYVVGSYCGDFYSNHLHAECDAAGKAYADMTGYWGEEYTWFQHHDSETSDWEWMVAHHPIVAKRLGWDNRLSEWKQDDSTSPHDGKAQP